MGLACEEARYEAGVGGPTLDSEENEVPFENESDREVEVEEDLRRRSTEGRDPEERSGSTVACERGEVVEGCRRVGG